MSALTGRLGYEFVNEAVHTVTRKLGFDFVKYEPTSHPLARRKRLLEGYGINVVLDVGASTGGYGKQLRRIGYKGRIISFEPLGGHYQRLQAHTKDDGAWEVHNFAIGDRDGKDVINVAGDSSSLLEMLPTHLDAAPGTKYTGQQEIDVKTIDSIFRSLCTSGDRVYLKIDTQGFEENVLKGAARSLQSIDTIQLELSLVPLYENARTFSEMHGILSRSGYSLVSIEPGFTDKRTGQLLQVDGVYHRLK